MTEPDVAEALRTVRPIKVVALLDDDREVPIAIPRGTRRWERMAATLSSQPWTEVRMYDKSGGLMAAPLVREARPDAPAGALETLPSSAADRLVDPFMVERIVRSTTEANMRAFVEVAKCMRSSGSAEVTAALTVNRETLSALSSMVEGTRDDLAAAQQRIAELEAELAQRLIDDAKPKAEPETSPAERMIERFASGFMDGDQARKAEAPTNGAGAAK